ncbi:MAG: diguanylate cyclase, partial [Lachnospiraceae bacterium]|nr:diguanylate cyclase [Lachnospiraceae bacterium]
AGIIAVDFDAEWFQGEVRHLYAIVASFILFALISSVILAIAIAFQYRRFFANLMNKMNSLASGIDTLIHEADMGYESDDYMSLVHVDDDKGERVIIGIAHDICEVFGEKRVSRVGGDEFVVILDETDFEDKIKALKDIINRKSAEATAKHNAKADVGLSV